MTFQYKIVDGTSEELEHYGFATSLLLNLHTLTGSQGLSSLVWQIFLTISTLKRDVSQNASETWKLGSMKKARLLRLQLAGRLFYG